MSRAGVDFVRDHLKPESSKTNILTDLSVGYRFVEAGVTVQLNLTNLDGKYISTIGSNGFVNSDSAVPVGGGADVVGGQGRHGDDLADRIRKLADLHRFA